MTSSEALGPFFDRNFEATSFAESLLRRHPENILAQKLSTLQELQKTAASELQRTVIADYKEFIGVAKDISYVEGEMVQLHGSLLQLQSHLQDLRRSELQLEARDVIASQDEVQLAVPDAMNDWLADLPTQLEVSIGERNLERAVALLETVEKKRASLPADVADQVASWQARLEEILARELHDQTLSWIRIQRIVGMLLRLGRAEKAAALFLSSRSEYLHEVVRKIRFPGDLLTYISSFSMLTFSCLRETAERFRAMFGEAVRHSMLSLWVISEVDLFLQRFTQQVLDAEEEVDNFEAVIGCLKAAFEATRQMDAAGVSVMFFVERKLVVPVSKAVRNTYIRLRAELLRRLEDDDYVPRSAPADSSVSLVSATTKFLREALMQRLTGLTPLMLDSYYLSVVDGLVSVVFSYCEMIRDRFLAFDEAARLEAPLLMLGDLLFVSETVLPAVGRKLQLAFQRPVPDVDTAAHQVRKIFEACRLQFLSKFSSEFVERRVQWGSRDYSQNDIELDRAQPYAPLIDLFVLLGKLKSKIQHVVGERFVAEFMELFLSVFVDQLSSHEQFWNTNGPPRRLFGLGGLQQFVLDVRVLQTAAGGYLTEATRQQMTRMVERALVHYCRSSGRRDVKGVLQPEAWFDSKVNHALERLVRSQQEAAASTAAAAAAAAVAATPPLAPTAAPPSSASSRVTPTRTVQLDDAY